MKLFERLVRKNPPPPVEIDAETIVRRARDVMFTELDDELLAIDAQANACYSLNSTAGRVWDMIYPPAPVGAVCARLRQEYTVDEKTCLREVIALLQQLEAAGLVAVGDAPAA
jgi:hypothetical protein